MGTVEHSVDDVLVQRSWPESLGLRAAVAAEDAVEGQDQRHGRGLLEAQAARRSALARAWPVFWLPANHRWMTGFDVVGVAQRLEVADPVSRVGLFLDVERWLFHALRRVVSTTLQGGCE